ncbi:MAG: hypothetical protein AAFX02_09575 [Pseudomonadota bacterium]
MTPNWIKRLFSKRSEGAIGCIDFGTAFSKFAIVETTESKGLGEEKIHPLAIGQDIHFNRYLLPSILFLTEDEVLFGQPAEKAALRQSTEGRRAFTSLKRYISTSAIGSLNEALPADIDPTETYTASELITAYLAYLLHRAELAAQAEKLAWPPKLRVARPAWDAERTKLGEPMMRGFVRHAFILFDRLEAKIGSEGGVSHTDLRAALSEIPDTSDFPDSEIFHFTESGTATVCEAAAVAAASVRYPGPRIVVIADIGGGTSDFSAYATHHGRSLILEEVKGSTRSLGEAGDALDACVLDQLMRKSGLPDQDPLLEPSRIVLQARQRELKEILFSEGQVIADVGDVSVILTEAEFLADPVVAAFSQRLKDTFLETVGVAVSAAQKAAETGFHMPIEIMPTGGGFALPMVAEMIETIPHEWRFIPAAPDLFQSRNPDFDLNFRQLAVSVGGALKDLPIQSVAESN